MRPYYELHVTFVEPGDFDRELPRPWKYSRIDGDPVLGDGTKSYATRQAKRDGSDQLPRLVAMLSDCAAYLSTRGCRVLRQKVELVTFDTKEFEVPA